jgi:hypothetical protein
MKFIISVAALLVGSLAFGGVQMQTSHTVQQAPAQTGTPASTTTYVYDQRTNVQCPQKQRESAPSSSYANQDRGDQGYSSRDGYAYRTNYRNSVTPVLRQNHPLRITVTGEGVAPVNTTSPAQAYALAKRAAIADAYRLIAERVEGVKVEGHDLVRNMMVQRTSVRTSVYAMVRNANVVQTTFKDGLCEVEMDILVSYSQFVQ